MAGRLPRWRRPAFLFSRFQKVENMQTFLPYPSFSKSARVLDDKRLGKQRVECKQILRALGVDVGGVSAGRGWISHPAVLMWRGCEQSLCAYAIAMCDEWMRRKFADSLRPQFIEASRSLRSGWRLWSPGPSWLGDHRVHASHRSNLLRKDPVHYGQFGWSEPDDLPYVWPRSRVLA
jgi:hypothetical protein